jgi:uroporphyrinogen decarboxylase
MFHTDVRGVYPAAMRPGTWDRQRWIEGDQEYVIDEWNTKWRKEVDGGLYFDIIENPFREEEITAAEVERFPWPDPANSEDFTKTRERAQYLYDTYQCAIFLENPLVTIFDTPCRLRGHDVFYMDFLLRPDVAEALMDGMLRLQLEYFRKALEALKGLPVIVRTSDDLGTQSSLTVSPDTYYSMIKPRHKQLFDGIRAAADGDVKIFFHCDGAIKSLIPDFIELGIDCLNPVQDTCVDMDLAELKREFGSDITFWGAGVETQGILRSGTPQEVADDVKRRIETLAPGGGFVFASVHNVQPDVPVENIEALWKTVGEYR